ncbi:MAG: hypothetical protein PHZ02_09565, partial [Desulfocapsaceae bacterium]|nr:hypothetical protein [Desulfocapsaceae bacterium]
EHPVNNFLRQVVRFTASLILILPAGKLLLLSLTQGPRQTTQSAVPCQWKNDLKSNISLFIIFFQLLESSGSISLKIVCF